MYTVSAINALFLVYCWINMRLFKPYSTNQFTTIPNQSTTHNLVWDEGAPKNTFVLSPHTRRSVPGSKYVKLTKNDVKLKILLVLLSMSKSLSLKA